MDIIKSSIYYNTITGKITLPNLSKIWCSKCDNDDYMCLLCKKCKLHNICSSGVKKFMKQGIDNGRFTNTCIGCNVYSYSYWDEDVSCDVCCICYICNGCHSDIPCKTNKKYCVECDAETIYCVGCEICLKHECHTCKQGSQYIPFINIESSDKNDYSKIYYTDRCNKCITFIEPAKESNWYVECSLLEYLKSTLWICRLCVHVECGLCFNQRAQLCSLCLKKGDSYFNFEDFDGGYFKYNTENKNYYKRGETCGICGVIVISHIRDDLHHPYLCIDCKGDSFNRSNFDIKRIPKLRNKLPHVSALVPLSVFPDIIKYTIFEYYYEERHYLTGELD